MSLILLLHALSCICWSAYDGRDTVGRSGMIVSSNYLATAAGTKILESGGTAADAALAVQAVMNFVQPHSCGIGGGVFIMYYDSNTNKVYSVDGREEAPNAYSPYVFCENVTCHQSYDPDTGTVADGCKNCDSIPFSERKIGGLSVGVPGTLAAFHKLWKVFGNQEWSDLFVDAIEIGTNGFRMYDELFNFINQNIEPLSRFESTCKTILNYPHCNQTKFEIGDIATFPDLANTFTLLSENDAAAMDLFYNGKIAKEIVEQTKTKAVNKVSNRGGVMELSDINGYSAVFREPVHSTFNINEETFDIYGMNMPSSGPLTQQYTLKLLELLMNNEYFQDFKGRDLQNEGMYSGAFLHYLYSAINIAFSDRNQYMADMDFVNVPVEGIQDESYILKRAKDYLTETIQSQPIPYGYPNGWNSSAQSTTQESGTAHFSIVDKYGNVASITTTIEGVFGASYVVDGYGFFLNNELTDFSSVGIVDDKPVANGPEGGKKQRKSALNIFGYSDSSSNGGKRPRSSMSPTIILYDNKPFLAVGSPGGASIISTTINVIARVLIFDIGVQQAVDASRIYGFNNGYLPMETSWMTNNLNFTDELEGFGYNVANIYWTSWGRGSAIEIGSGSAASLMYCGADVHRWSQAKCQAVCEEFLVCELNQNYQTTTGINITIDQTEYDIQKGDEQKQTSESDSAWKEIGIIFIILFIVVAVLSVYQCYQYKKMSQNSTVVGHEAVNSNENTIQMVTR